MLERAGAGNRRGDPRRRSREDAARPALARAGGCPRVDARRQPPRLDGRLSRRLRGHPPGARARAARCSRAQRPRTGRRERPRRSACRGASPRSSRSSTRSSRCRSPTSAPSSPSTPCRRPATCSGSPSRWWARARSRWALNRLIDAEIDARNPRTAGARAAARRAQPPAGVGVLRASRSLVFLVAVWQLDPLVRWLWPIPVAGFVDLPLSEALHLAVPPLARRGGRAGAGRRLGRAHRRAALAGVDPRRRRRGLGRRLRPLLLALRRRGRPARGAALVGDALGRARRLPRRPGAARADGGAARRRGSRARRRTSFYWLGVRRGRARCSPTSTRSCAPATCAGSTPRSSRQRRDQRRLLRVRARSTSCEARRHDSGAEIAHFVGGFCWQLWPTDADEEERR